MNQWMSLLENILSPWIYVPLLFLLWVLAAGALKQAVTNRLLRITKYTSLQFDALLISSLSKSLGVVILGVGLLFFSRFLPLNADWNRTVSVLFKLSIISAAVLFADYFLKGLLEIHKQKIQMGISPAIVSILLRSILFGIGALIFLDLIGVSITPLLASLGLGSLSIGLALQETLTNLFSGIHMSFDKPIRVGDFIKLESGEEGYVMEIGWRSTRIRMPPNNMVIVPNQKLTSSIITNYYLPDKELAMTVPVGVHYNSDLEQVERVTVEVARSIMKKVQGGVPEFEPCVRYFAFDNSSINFNVILRAKEYTDQHLIKHEFIKALHARYKKEGIVIPFPVRTIDLSAETVDALKQIIISRKQ